jgi:beta-galactosidase GanA
VKEFGAAIEQYGSDLYQARPMKAQVAILVDMVGLLKTLEQTTEMATNKFMYESNAGLFKALFEGNISADFLRMDRGLSLETLKQYKIIYLPFQIVMRREIADMLKEYVRQGGCLVADARTATIDELDFAYKTSPGAGLDSLFGAVRPDWIGQKTYFTVKTHLPGEQDFQFEGKYFRDQLQPIDSVTVLGTFADDSTPAVIENHFGKGTAVLSAVPLGASYLDMPDNPVNKLILDLASNAGVTQDARFISDDHEFVSLKVHTFKDKIVVYLINSDDLPKSGTLEINVGKLKVASLKEILTNENIPFKEDGEIVSIPLNVPKKGVMVFFIQ